MNLVNFANDPDETGLPLANPGGLFHLLNPSFLRWGGWGAPSYGRLFAGVVGVRDEALGR